MKKFLLTCEETCPKCNGAKLIPHPAWAKFDESMRKWLDENPEPLHCSDEPKHFKKWLEAKHHQEYISWYALGYENGPPCKEISCDLCNCTGIYRHEVALLEALKALRAEELKPYLTCFGG